MGLLIPCGSVVVIRLLIVHVKEKGFKHTSN